MHASNSLIDYARGWINTPYRHQGRDHNGIDCIGFLLQIIEHAGWVPNDFIEYSRWPDGTELLRHIRRNTDCIQEITVSEMTEADMPLFWIRRPGFPQHGAILGQRGRTLIHTHALAGRILEEPFTHWWHKRISNVFRIKTRSE